MSEKKKLRNEAAIRRAELATAVPSAGEVLATYLLGHLSAQMPRTISAYWPISTEIDSRPIMERLHVLGTAIALPRVTAENTALEFRQWKPGDSLVRGAFGTYEPKREASKIEPEVLLLPLLAFDAMGGRLGYGGGFYDRTLSVLRQEGKICAIGMAYSGQQVDRVPMGPHDEFLDFIATEAGIVTARRD